MIVGIYAGILALWLVWLSAQVIKWRQRFQVGVGDGGHPQLARAIRVQGNFTEYVPLALIMMYLLEVQGFAHLWLHMLGCILVVGRVLHSLGVSQVKENLIYRKLGMVSTFTCLVVSALALIGLTVLR